MGHHDFAPTGRPEPGREGFARPARSSFGGPPPWLSEMFGPGGRGWDSRGRGPGGPGGRGGHGRRHAGRGPRVRRGDVRAAIIDVLATNAGTDGAQPLNGYAVIQEIAERTDGVWKPSPGSVYPTIAQLEDEGLVLTSAGEGRKTLALTDAGSAYAAEHPDEMADVWAPFDADTDETEGVDLKHVIGQTMSAVWQIASSGTTAQVQEAVVVLGETRRKLYTILAEGDPE